MKFSEQNSSISRENALQLLKKGIKAVHGYNSVVKHLILNGNILNVTDIFGNRNAYDINAFANVYVIGAGKVAPQMAKAIKDIFGEKITLGRVITKYGFAESSLEKIEIEEAAHPIPDENGISATKKIIKLCESAGENDLIIFLLSGGASALLTMPIEGITLNDLQSINELLLSSGMTIHEINCVRKQISNVKGGKLASIAKPAAVITLAISDVIGDDIDIIGSAPTKCNNSSIKDAYKILNEYKLIDKIPVNIKNFITKKIEQEMQNTMFDNFCINEDTNIFIVANNQMALTEIKHSAEKSGYKSTIITNSMQGEAKKAAKDIVKYILKYANSCKERRCLIFGGETTVNVAGNGKGGRNQELCLSAAIELDGLNNVVLMSCGTDGNDGPTDAAGAICNGKTIDRADSMKLIAEDYLANNDSYTFFTALNDLIKLPRTYTNVMDIAIVLIN